MAAGALRDPHGLRQTPAVFISLLSEYSAK